jgi:1,4-alpha-glucan branching enzyme
MSFNSLDDYFNDNTNHDAVLYLSLANTLAHEVKPNSITIAEDVSGMPGLGRPSAEGGIGFDYRLGMGIPDHWIRLIKEKADEDWDLGDIWWSLTNRPMHEKTVGYAESHDQALVGDQTIAFRLMGPSMYQDMAIDIPSLVVERGVSLHKIIRMLTLSLGGEGYLNFMGNEWGHPEWIDFPRVGNDWSYQYARRQWSLADAPYLRYQYLGNWDKEMVAFSNKYQLLETHWPELLNIDHDNQIMSYFRGPILFVVNLHPTKSVVDYLINLPNSEPYSLALSSDDAIFGGYERQPSGINYWPDEKGDLLIYVPNRTILTYVPFSLLAENQ